MKMDKILKQAQRMQAQMAEMQEQLALETVEGAAGGGMVRAKVNGQGDLLEIRIDREVVNPNDVEMLEDLVLSAVKEALRLGRELADSKMGSLTGGLNFPGLM